MTHKPEPAWVRPVVDYAGLIAFGLVYLLTRDILQATWAIVAGSALGLAVGFAFTRKIAPLPLIAGLSGLVFGGLSLVFHDAIFIKMKLTIVDGLICVVLLGGLAFGKLPMKALLGGALTLTTGTWRKLSLNYGIFFGLLAVVNAVVVMTQSESAWVMFRFPGVPIIAVVFSLTQLPLMMRDLKTSESNSETP